MKVNNYNNIYIYCIVIYILSLGFIFTSRAQNANLTLGGGAGELDIRMTSDGKFNIFRKSQKQIYSPISIFSIRIGSKIYTSAGETGTKLTIIGNDIINNIGTSQERIKTFQGTYSGQIFTVVVNFNYNTSNPDYMVITSTIDLRGITEVASFAYGFDSYVNNCDGGFARLVPDINNRNNGIRGVEFLSQSQINQLRLVAGQNNAGVGSLIGFFPIGRAFSSACCAYSWSKGFSYNIISTRSNEMLYGPWNNVSCSSGGADDNGIGVVYDIPSNQIVELRTGLTFTTDLDGELDYFWSSTSVSNSKNLTANLGDQIYLDLVYQSYNVNQMNNVAFRANFPGLNINGLCNINGFGANTNSCGVSNDYYKISNATIAPLSQGSIKVPVTVTQCGQWSIDGNSISEMSRTLPLGDPALLTVKASVNLAPPTTASVCKGSSATFTVRFDNSVTPAHNAVISLEYSGNTTSFTNLPTTVTIPANSNSATFTIQSNSTAPDNSNLTITLKENSPFVTIGATKTATVNLYNTPTITTTLSNQTVCGGTTVNGITLVGSIAGSTFSWTNSNTAIGLAASGTGNIPQFTATNTGSNAISGTIKVTPNKDCSGTPKEYTITVNPQPAKPIITATGPTTFCEGGSVILTSSSTANSYQWYKDGNPISGAIYTTYSTATSGSYTVKAKNTYGCESLESDATNVTVNPQPTQPTVGILVGAVPFCEGSKITLTSLVTGNSYIWYKDGVEVAGETSKDYEIGEGGRYSVVVISDKGCYSVESAKQVITMWSKPTASISGNKVICENSSPTSLEMNLTGRAPFEVIYSDGTTDFTITGIGNTYTINNLFPSQTTSYYVKEVRDANGCINTDAELKNGTGTIYVQPCGLGSVPVMIWLKANEGVDLVGSNASVWRDQSGSGSEDTPATTVNQPVSFKPTAINFNPAVKFDGHSGGYMLGKSNHPFPGSYTVFAVSKSETTGTTNNRMGIFTVHTTSNPSEAGPGLIYMDSSSPYYAMDAKSASSSNTASTAGMSGNLLAPSLISGIANDPGTTANSNIYLNGQLSSNTFTPTTIDVNADNFVVGGRIVGGVHTPFDGLVAEVLFYSAALSINDMYQAESYLAIKYGITLQHEYRMSNGAPVWSITSNTGYNNEITGLARDKGYGDSFEQRVSRNENPGNDILTIAVGNVFKTDPNQAAAISSDKSYFMWGNNSATKTFAASPTNSKFLFNRRWKAQKTGSGIDKLSLRFSMNGISLPAGGTGEVILMVSYDPSFASGTLLTSKTAIVSGNDYFFEGVSIPSGAFFTLAIPDKTSSNLTGVSLWLKADKDLIGSPTITQWKDQSPNADIYSAKNTPSRYLTADQNINFNPLVRMDNNDYFMGNTLVDLAHVYVVGNYANQGAQTLANSGAILGDQAGVAYLFRDMNTLEGIGFHDLNTSVTTYNYASKPGGVHLFGYKSVPSGKKNTYYLDGKAENLTNNVTVSPHTARWYVGATGLPNAYFQGDVAEILAFYDTINNENKRLSVETYLAIKYGISSKSNYLTSDYNIIWNNTANPYDNQIAGIGRDDATTLKQTISHNVQPGKDMLTVANGSAFPIGNLTAQSGAVISADKSYFIWGNNNQNTTFEATSQLLDGNKLYLLKRKWMGVKSGTGINPLSMQFDTTGMNIAFPSGAGKCRRLVLVISEYENFSSARVVQAQDISSMGLATFNNVSISASTLYFTLATVEVKAGIDGNNQTTCSVQANEEFTLSANLAAGEVGEWSLKSIQGGSATDVTIASPTDISTKVKLPVQNNSDNVIATFRWLVTNTLTGCQDSAFINITRYTKPLAPITQGDLEYCPNATAASLFMDPLNNHTLQWFIKNPNWTPLGGAPTPSTDKVGSVVYGIVQKNTVTQCESDTTTIKVTVHPTITNYPDIRLQFCSHTDLKYFDLSSYLDTTYQQSVNWAVASVGSPVPSDPNRGTIQTEGISVKTHAYTYSVSNFCMSQKMTRKLYLKVLNGTYLGNKEDTIVVCKDNVGEINLNQVLGLTSYDGVWSCDQASDPVYPYIRILTAPSIYAGARILQGLQAYNDISLKETYTNPRTGEIDPDAVHLRFSYNSSSSCISGEKKLVVIITSKVF